MSWIQFGIMVDKNLVDIVEEKLTELGALAISFTDAADDAIFEPGENTLIWEKTIIKGLYSATKSDVIEDFKAWMDKNLGEESKLSFLSEQILEEDWLKATKASFPPLQMADNLWVIPEWHEKAIEDAINLRINPGLAFGTGNHATTALCLSWLAQNNVANKSILDYGCGSGILAIGALLLGAKTAWGTDIDKLALQASLENAKLNGVEDKFNIVAPKELPELKVDIVVANILTRPLITLAPVLVSYLAPDGQICLSGILERQAEQVAQTYAQWIEWQNPTYKDGWARLTGKLKPQNI